MLWDTESDQLYENADSQISDLQNEEMKTIHQTSENTFIKI